MKKYKLQLLYDPVIEKEYNGNFAVKKEYIVTNITKPSTKIEGIIIQYVNKKSVVKDASNNIYNTTEQIDKFTSGEVKYSNDTYFEIFDIVDFKDNTSVSIYADEFANNSLTQYEYTEDGDLIPYTYEPDDPEYNIFKTKGEINIIGKNCFISKTNKAYNSIMRLQWNTSKNTPANGLPYLTYSNNIYNLIFNLSDSNILEHNVIATWNFEDPNTSVISTVTDNVFVGGIKRCKFNKKNAKKHNTRKYKRIK